MDRYELNAILKEALVYLMRQGMSQADIGRAIGFPNGAMVGKVFNEGALFGPIYLVNLMSLLARSGYVLRLPMAVLVPLPQGANPLTFSAQVRGVLRAAALISKAA